MDAADWHLVVFLLGPWLVGGVLDFLLQGILFCQFVSYFNWYKDDKRGFIWMVVGLLVLTTLKTVQVFALVWIQSVVHFDDIDGAVALSYTAWWQIGNGLMVAVIGLYVQSFFCYRLYIISQKWWVVAPIVAILIFALVASVMSTIYIASDQQIDIRRWYAAHLSSVFGGDTIMAMASAYFLLQKKPEDGLKRTNELINTLVRLTFQTATPAVLCAMLNLIFSQIYAGTNKLVSVTFNLALPKIYAISMMWTLNARRAIRISHSSVEIISSRSQETDVRFRTPRTEVELGAISGTTIQTRTESETVHHHDNDGENDSGANADSDEKLSPDGGHRSYGYSTYKATTI